MEQTMFVNGFQTSAGSSASHLGNSMFSFSAAPPAPTPTLGQSTWTPSFGSKETRSGFGNSVLGQNGKGSRVSHYTSTGTVEDNGKHGKLVSISSMKIHSMKSHEELRAEDYQLGDKGGVRHASISQGSIGVAGTQRNNSSFPAPSSDTSLHPHVPAFPNSFAPQPSMDTISKGWSSVARVTQPTLPNTLPWMQSKDANGLVSSKPNVAVSPQIFTNTSVLPSFQDHSKPSVSNPFSFQTNSTGVKSFQNPFNSFAPNSSGWLTSSVNSGIQSEGCRSAGYTATSGFPATNTQNSSQSCFPCSNQLSNPATSMSPFSLNISPTADKWPSSHFSPSTVSFPPQKILFPPTPGFPATNAQNSSQNSFPSSNPFSNPATSLSPFSSNISSTADKWPSSNFSPSTITFPPHKILFPPTSGFTATNTLNSSQNISPPSNLLSNPETSSNPFINISSSADKWPSSNFSPSTITFPPQKILFPPTPGFPATNTQNSSQNSFPCSNPLSNPAKSLNPFSLNISPTAHSPICSTAMPPPSQFNFSTTSLSSVSSAIPGISTEMRSTITNNGSQALQSFAPLDRHTNSCIGSQTTPNPVPQYISNPMTPTQAPQNISRSVITTFEQQPVIANSYEALTMEHTSITRPETIVPIRYGISSRPITDNPAPARRSSLLRVRHLSFRRNRVQADTSNAKSDAPKVAFFTEVERNCVPVKAGSIFPRKNPGCWISPPSKELFDKLDSHVPHSQSRTNSSSEDRTSGSVSDDDHSFVQTDQHVDVTVHCDQDVEVVVNSQDHNEYLEVILPKLRGADYYTEPSIREIAAKEKTEPGFCSRVRDFIVGRVGYGCIKFLGETDIRKLELDSIIEFNLREILVYFNENMEKPPVGQGLNKPAEVTLLNLKCNDKKSGKQYIDGPMVDKYRERIIKKTAEQGAEFVSYNRIRGEWQFKVQHF